MAQKLERKVPKVGVILNGTYLKKQYSLKVVQTKDGLGYELNGKIYKTPSAAAKSITKFEVNGWRFWHMKRE